ncbi:hypothetical protein ACJIZ3_006399 [Penstemon smallii]|uniref:Glycine-rich protein n=1 Tax=Penstemon smallii TaxID=265156 RepID=A0ABD3S7M6_9LAMI
MKKSTLTTTLVFSFLLMIYSTTSGARPTYNNDDTGMNGFFEQSELDIPGLGQGGGGYGFGYGGPSGGHSSGGIIRPTVVCQEKGPCYNMKLTCPAKCFKSYSGSGKGYGGGGGGGGCTYDCKEKCNAYC